MALLTENRGDGERSRVRKQELLGHVKSATLLGCPGKTQEESSVHTLHEDRMERRWDGMGLARAVVLNEVLLPP